MGGWRGPWWGQGGAHGHHWGPPGRQGRPRWWPESEPWPPRDREVWRRRGRRLARRAGCALALVILVLGITGTAAIWLVASALGIVGSSVFVRIVSAAALLLGVVAVMAAMLGVRRLAAPANRLVEAAGRVEQGEYDTKVPVRGPAELRSLARAFNAMSSRLMADEARRRSTVADVAHELRTPLAIIRGQAEGIADGIYPADPERMAPILDATRSLELLVDDLATLALAEAGSLRLAREPVDVAILVNQTLNGFRAGAGPAGIALVEDVSDDVAMVDADPARLRAVLSNLLGNALRHTPAGGTIRVAARTVPQGVRIDVQDSGEGIPPDLLPHVFDRFVKGPQSPGSGLGLAIVRDIVEAHGGTVTAESGPGQGTIVRVTLPAAGHSV